MSPVLKARPWFSHPIGQDWPSFEEQWAVAHALSGRTIAWSLPAHGGEPGSADVSVRALARRLVAALDDGARGLGLGDPDSQAP